jgi:ABC-type multidrug transport system ATPase subunit
VNQASVATATVMILEFNNVSLTRGAVRALNDVSFSVSAGQVIFLVGRNGAGKTSLIKCATGLIEDFSGEISLFGAGNKSKRQFREMKTKVGVMIDSPFGYEHLSAEQNLEVFRQYFGLPKPVVGNTLILLGLERVSNRKLHDLSLGMRQRLSIGLAILNDPGLVILDEPFANLDVESKIQMRNLISFLQREKSTSFLISSHDLEEAHTLASRIFFLHEGRLRLIIERECFDRIVIGALPLDQIPNDDFWAILKESAMLYRIHDSKMEFLLVDDKARQLITRTCEKFDLSPAYQKATLEEAYLLSNA